MVDSSNIGMKYVAPAIGTITANMLFFAGLVSLIKFRRKEARRTRKIGAETINPFVSLTQFGNGLLWVFFGFLLHDPFIILSNIFGVVTSFWSILILHKLYADKRSKRYEMYNLVMLFILFTHLSITFFFVGDYDIRLKSVSYFAAFTAVLLGLAPLATAWTVIKTRDASSIFVLITITQIVNSTMWFIYGLVLQSVAITLPSAFGLLFGAIQAILKMLFKSKIDEDGVKHNNNPFSPQDTFVLTGQETVADIKLRRGVIEEENSTITPKLDLLQNAETGDTSIDL